MTRNVRHLLAALAIAAAAGTGGFLAGTSAAESADWHTGTARVMGHPDDPDIVARVDGGDDGWDYATTGDIEWIDENGTHHSGDTWPECLPGGAGGEPTFRRQPPDPLRLREGGGRRDGMAPDRHDRLPRLSTG